jgi:hypothetical protein
MAIDDYFNQMTATQGDFNPGTLSDGDLTWRRLS